jgi:hypothetical protein
MLLQRDMAGDRERAGVLLREAITDYHAIGAPRHERMARAMLARLRPRRPPVRQDRVASAAPSGEQGNVFRKEGEYWTIGYEGTTIRLRDSAGLRYLARLLERPGQEFLAMTLAVSAQGLAAPPDARPDEPGLGLGVESGEPVVDRQAQASYKRKLVELAAELEEAEALGDAERAAQVQAERDTLVRHLAQAVGLGGRSRRFETSAERARVSVTKAVRKAMDRIEESHPKLGRHLEGAVRTGKYCSYDPGRGSPTRWQV